MPAVFINFEGVAVVGLFRWLEEALAAVFPAAESGLASLAAYQGATS